MTPNNTKRERPDLNDMFVAGLPLRTAVAFEAEMDAAPDVSPDVWWRLLASLAVALYEDVPASPC